MKLKITQTKRAFIKELNVKTFLIILIFICNYNVFSQTTHNITNPNQLTAAFSLTLGAGDTVILADGTYDSDARIKFSPTTGTMTMPITLRPQTPGGVKFTGGLKMSIGGDYVVIDGFHWQGGYGASNFIEFRDSSVYANNSTIQNCVIDGLGIEPGDLSDALEPTDPEDSPAIPKHRWIVLYGTHNTVINCSFMNKVSAGALVLVELEYNASPDDGTTNTRCTPVGHTISNNYFYNFEKMDDVYAAWGGADLSNAGDSETIRVGTSEFQNVNSDTTVSNNYFVQADGENEIITNKSKGNIYTNNTFRRCRGSLVLRHGSHALVDGNYFLGENIDGTGGIRIVDSNHNITNNYIQDCITVGDNAIWNNGITFLGGNDNNAVACGSTSTSNGYQKAFNNNLSNNSIVNTNAPLFFNVNTGTTNVTGTVSNNLIYFADNSTPRYSEVISGNGGGYSAFGTALTYSSNVYNGTTLGTGPPTGFSLEAGITATTDGEIFNFTGAPNKGADTSNSEPTTDAMVGYGVGACFLDYSGATITSPTCTIVEGETLIVGSLPTFTYLTGSQNASVTANVSWTAASDNPSWISIDITSGAGDATVSVTVTENTGTESRTGSVTFTQVAGGDDIERTLTVTQSAPPPPDPRDGLNLINPNVADVDAIEACHEEIPPNHTKTNPKENSLDKDLNTQWAGSAELGSCVNDRVYVIYDLKGAFDLELVDIATTNNKTYLLQILVSSTGTADGDFTNPFPAGDLLSNTDDSFKAFVLPNPALAEGTKYVKLIGNGQTGGSRYTTIHEIEFYGDASSLSVDDNTLANKIMMYPNPAKDIVTFKNINNNVNSIQVFSLDGRKVLDKFIKLSDSELTVDVSTLSNGAYLFKLSNGIANKQSKMLIVSH